MAAAKSDKRIFGFPKQIMYIVGNEAAERYSFYGMRSILVIFMVQYLMLESGHATAVFHYFTAACYLLPLLGAYLSDRFWGKYKTIMILSIVYCAGHAVLSIWENEMGMYWGLGLIALGAGGIKPCVSANVGDQFKSDEKDKLKKVFDLFYWMINFGSTFSTLITPITLKMYGPSVAFGIPGILMGIATLIFWMGRKNYVYVPPSGANPHGTGRVLLSAVKNMGKGSGFFGGAELDHPKQNVDDVRSAFAVFKVFFMVTMFWALFDQHSSTWVLQAREMDLHVNFFGLWEKTLLPSQIAALNPIMVMTLIPLFSFGIYPFMAKFFAVTPLRRMGIGMFITGLSFIMVGIIQYLLDGGTSVNVAWHFLPFLTITAAEIMVSITGLEFSYTQAPRTMKSTIMSLYFLTIFFGNILTGSVAQLAEIKILEPILGGGNFFMFFAALMFVCAIIFAWIAKGYVVKDYMEH